MLRWESEVAFPDPLAALRTFLKQDQAVSDLVGGRVFAFELPDKENKSMPRAAVVLRQTGGGVFIGGSTYLRLGDTRVDASCYGATAWEASQVSLAVHTALKQMRRNTQGNVLLHWCNPSGGPTNLRDPDAEWPFVLTVWQVLAAEQEVAA